MELIKNEVYKLTITGTTSEGSGVGKIDGFAIFVPNTTVDDVCLVKIVKLNKSYGFGKLESIITPSTSRIEVDCDKFEQCGGCTYRHISYEAELKIKSQLVESSFKRIGEIDTPISPIIPSEFQSHYRNKAQYPVGKNADGQIVSGFYAKRSHRIVSKCNCDLQPEFFADIQHDILDFLNENNISIYNEENHTGLIRHIYIRYAQMTNEIMVCLVATSSNVPKLDRLITLLTQKYDNIKSIVVNVNKEKTNVILGQQCKTIFGDNYITDEICGIKIKISPLSFYQVNRNQAEVLYNKAIEYADLKESDTLIDLYCGTGTIGLSAASKVKSLIGVEIIEQAIDNANENARINLISNAKFICADAGKAAKILANEGIRPDIIIVDPPRKGLDLDVIEAICTMAPSRLVMVSCNPTTAARDCKMFVERGYKVKAITPVDMFPRTTHVECTILMIRCGKSDE